MTAIRTGSVTRNAEAGTPAKDTRPGSTAPKGATGRRTLVSPSSVDEIIEILEKLGVPAELEGIKTFMVTIEPEVAEKLMAANENFRTLKPQTLARYAEDFLTGGWRFTGEPIIFDCNGKLRDGQHRLYTCIQTGVTFSTLVVVGVEPDALLNIDTGAKRTLADYLRYHDYDNPKSLAAAIRLAYEYEKIGKVTQNGRGSNNALMTWFVKDGHEGLTEDVRRVKLWERDIPVLTASHMGAIRHSASNVIDIEDVDSFFSALAYKESVTDVRSPVVHLREAFLRMKAESKSRGVQIPMIVATTIKALNAYVAGDEVTDSRSLYWASGGRSPEDFPQIQRGLAEEILAGGNRGGSA